MTTTLQRSDEESSASPGPSPIDRLRCAAGKHWAVLVVFAAFVVSALVVPTLSHTARHDDWVYSRAVANLVDHHRFVLSPLAAANTVFDVLWGALFALIFGMKLGVLRASSVVLVFLSGVAFYALALELGIARGRAALGTAAYLFNPIGYALAFSFMTDPHLLALIVIAVLFYVRGLDDAVPGWKGTVLGSTFAGLAFLSRPQGVLIPVAVFGFSVLTGRVQMNRAGLRRAGEILAIPAVVVLAFYGSLMLGNGLPSGQGDFIHAVVGSPARVTIDLLRRHSFLHLAYLGFFVLPVAAVAMFCMGRLVRGIGALGWALVASWALLLVDGLRVFDPAPKTMPFAGSWFLRTELGPISNYGARGPLAPPSGFVVLTAACLASSVVLVLLLAGSLQKAGGRKRPAAGLLVAVTGAMSFGAIPPSYSFAPGTLDRYLLPMLPFVLLLALWALPAGRIPLVGGWAVVVAVGAFSVAGTRDTLVLEQTIWRVADRAIDQGARLDQLDAGAGWDGWQIGREDAAPVASRTSNAPWWVTYFAPVIDSTYVVSLAPWPGYDVVEQVPYSDWLHGGQPAVYLLRRSGY
jgi:hypothetical protein